MYGRRIKGRHETQQSRCHRRVSHDTGGGHVKRGSRDTGPSFILKPLFCQKAEKPAPITALSQAPPQALSRALGPGTISPTVGRRSPSYL